MSRYDDDDDIRGSRGRDRDDDDFDDDIALGGIAAPGQESVGLSVTSLVMGISSLVIMIVFGFGATCLGGLLFCCCPMAPAAGAFIAAGIATIPAILALIFGYFGMSQGGRGMAISGMVTGGITLVLGVLLVALSLLFGAAIFGAAAALPPPPPPPVQQPMPMPPQQRF